jgi:hypothetical protein
MGFLDALGHLFNLFLPALGVAALAAGLAKLLWRQALAAVRWTRLAGSGSLAGMAALAGGLLLTGRDGRMATYVALVLAVAVGLWWTGFGPGRRTS